MRAVECHCFRASVCVCSGHIPHHKCCSVYVLRRVQFAFHTTQFSHHIKHFHITHHSITSHQKILHHTTFHVTPFHTTPFHITPPLHNIPHHITTYRMFHATSLRHLMSQRISPRTTIFYIWHHSLPPTTISHHHISKHNIFFTSHSHSPHRTIPHPQLFHTTPTFNTTAHFTPHTTSSWFYIVTPPQLTSQHIASFSTSDGTLHMPHSSSPQFHTTTFHIT